MKFSKGFYNFNKEILLSELGSIAGSQLLSHLSSVVFQSQEKVSMAAVIGAMVGSSVWLLARSHDMHKHRGGFSVKKLAGDLVYFTPVAFLLACIIYYPVLYFISKLFLQQHIMIAASVFISQLIAFIVLLIALNIYRVVLVKVFKKRL